CPILSVFRPLFLLYLFLSFFFIVPSTSVISTLSLHDALPISRAGSISWCGPHPSDEGGLNPGALELRFGETRLLQRFECADQHRDRKSTRLNSSHDQISYAVFCLKKKKKKKKNKTIKRNTNIQ